MGKTSKVLYGKAAVCQVVYHSQSWDQDPWTSPDNYIPLPTRGNLIILSNSHVWATCPLIDIEPHPGTRFSGACAVSLIKKMGNWTLECMTHLKAAGKWVKTWGAGTLVPRLGGFQVGKDERKLHCIHCWVVLIICKHQSGNFFHVAPQVWFWLLWAYLPPCTAGMQYSGLFLLGSRHSGRAPAVVTLGGHHAGGDWLTPNSYPQSFQSSFRQHRPLGDWVTWTCIHSKNNSHLSLLAT